MNEEKDSTLIDPKYITTLLKGIFSDQELAIKEWRMTRITGGVEIISRIYRLTGDAVSQRQLKPWSMIIKKIHPEESFSDPSGFRYWKREIRAYQSQLLNHLPGNISKPEIYGIRENPDESYFIFMEDVHDDYKHPWSIDQFIEAAYQLGSFNGFFLTKKSLPEEEWVSRDWLRKYLLHATPMVSFIKQNPNHPAVKSLLPGLALPMTLAFWDEFPRLINKLDELPQTFCHQDAFSRNLFYRNEKFIAIDWGYAGIAPVGAELAPLIGVAFDYSQFPSSRAEELDQACFESYFNGLLDAGYKADQKQVRLGFILTMSLRYVLGGGVGERLPIVLDEHRRIEHSEALGITEDEVSQAKAEVVEYYQKIAMESLQSLGTVFSIRFISRTFLWAIRLAFRRKENNKP